MTRTIIDLDMHVLKVYLNIAKKQRERAATAMKTNYAAGDEIAKLLGAELHELENAIATMAPAGPTPAKK